MVEALTISSNEIACLPSGEINWSALMVHDGIIWPLPPEELALDVNDVHVWAVCLDATAKIVSHGVSILATDEKERAARFRFEKHRNRFVVGRAVLRSLVGRYLNCPPERLQFVYGCNGKPGLAEQFAGKGVQFNLAHSESIALIALTRLGPIGVDVEQIRPMTDADDLVARFFSPREHALFRELSADRKSIAFFNLWTRKEAWLKATGEGIAHSLNQVEVNFLPDEPASLLALPESLGSTDAWTLRELRPADSFIGAVALPNQRFSLSAFHFPTLQPGDSL